MSAESPTLARRYINGDPDVGQQEAYQSICDLEFNYESGVADVKAAVGDLPIPMPEPGTDMARLSCANVLLKRRVMELEQNKRELLEALRHALNIEGACFGADDGWDVPWHFEKIREAITKATVGGR